jgi:hypothetical protein
MKIKGVWKGKNLGEIAEYSAEEKVPLALQDAAAVHPDYYGLRLVWTRDVTIKSVSYSANGAPLKNKWQNNIYIASGEVVIYSQGIENNKLYTPKKRQFSIVFMDCLDDLGQPDLKIKTLELK